MDARTHPNNYFLQDERTNARRKAVESQQKPLLFPFSVLLSYYIHKREVFTEVKNQNWRPLFCVNGRGERQDISFDDVGRYGARREAGIEQEERAKGRVENSNLT